MPRSLPFSLLIIPLLAACQQQDSAPANVQRIALSDIPVSSGTPQPKVQQTEFAPDKVPGPDTSKARWAVAPDGRAIQFGNADEAPMLTLACSPRANPPQIRVIRHVPGEPGAKALFPVLGNGIISRFPVDAQVLNGEWAWVATLPARDPDLDVFTGRYRVTATLPGGGTLDIPGSGLPREFVRWCRSGGQSPTPG